ncbi:regulatory helix-turn-helix protein, lysR family [Sulfitobacter marinus]|uniref:Regulatory helix-turn-helix protein, lysR family n=1 Tax=Sulfitobacter marinus TaxID=394264 RepID=A0A1I6VL01_9RHOB|nr:LysR family transcriptional regulator [Sulfitobacter marinus]SFT14378.1 regulatory helix-turn-helix protein, lysR family [Sulfitobacter marinus]
MTKEMKIEAMEKVGQKAPALLYEMIRSFVVLADTLNLSHAVTKLDSTRQTVRRHIANLEERMGHTLFVVDNRRYQLTDVGREVLPEAIELLGRGDIWSTGKIRNIDGLLQLSHEQPNGWTFYQQQQPLTQIWQGESSMLRESFKGWVQSNGELDNPNFEEHRPYILVYRDSPNGWLCVEVGEESFYTKWWGWKNARSSIGRPLGQFPGGPEFEAMLDVPFREVQANGGVRLDEVVTQIPREEGGGPIPLAYKRLLMASRFPDGSFALIAVIDRSRSITISGLDQSTLKVMPSDAIVSF